MRESKEITVFCKKINEFYNFHQKDTGHVSFGLKDEKCISNFFVDEIISTSVFRSVLFNRPCVIIIFTMASSCPALKMTEKKAASTFNKKKKN